MAAKTKPRMEYRTRINYKNLKELRVRVDKEVHDFFVAQSYNKCGQRRGKGKILELLVKKFTTLSDSILD